MPRPKGSKNKVSSSPPWPMTLSTKERIDFLANAIVDVIIEDEEKGRPLLKEISAVEMKKHVDIIDDRIIGIFNDLKTYIDLRKDNRQHRNNDYGDNLGGGNMVMALGLFSALGLLSKAYMAVASSERGEFDKSFNDRGYARDEQKIFVEFVEFLGDNVALFDPQSRSRTSYRKVWERFRDFTTHTLVPDQGNIVVTYSWKEKQAKSVDEILEQIKQDGNAFPFENNDNSWTVNVDKLLSLLPEITNITTRFLSAHDPDCDKSCVGNLESVLWR